MSLLSPSVPTPPPMPARPPAPIPGSPLQRHRRPFSRANLTQTIAGGLPPAGPRHSGGVPAAAVDGAEFLQQPGEILTVDLKILPGKPELRKLQHRHDHRAVRPVLREQPDRHQCGRHHQGPPGHPDRLRARVCPFPVQNAIFVLILVALMVPPQVSILPNYVLIAGMGGENTHWGHHPPGLGGFGTFLLRRAFPEAARVHRGG